MNEIDKANKANKVEFKKDSGSSNSLNSFVETMKIVERVKGVNVPDEVSNNGSVFEPSTKEVLSTSDIEHENFPVSYYLSKLIKGTQIYSKITGYVVVSKITEEFIVVVDTKGKPWVYNIDGTYSVGGECQLFLDKDVAYNTSACDLIIRVFTNDTFISAVEAAKEISSDPQFDEFSRLISAFLYGVSYGVKINA